MKIIDIVYKSAAKLVVWGSIDGEGRKLSFQCRWDGKIVGFDVKQVETR